MTATPIYLDHAATTPLRPEALEAMLPHLQGAFGNPSSAHALGRQARNALDEARERLAADLGAAPREVVFSSGGTGGVGGGEHSHEVVRRVAQQPALRAGGAGGRLVGGRCEPSGRRGPSGERRLFGGRGLVGHGSEGYRRKAPAVGGRTIAA